MGTYHYHTIRCPHCGEDDGQVGCNLSGCHFAQESTDLTEYPAVTTCQHCGEAYSLDDGCWTGEIPPWNREELVSKEAAELIEAAVALAHKRIGFGEFKDIVGAYEESKVWAGVICPICGQVAKEIWAPLGEVSSEPFEGSHEAKCPQGHRLYYSYGSQEL